MEPPSLSCNGPHQKEVSSTLPQNDGFVDPASRYYGHGAMVRSGCILCSFCVLDRVEVYDARACRTDQENTIALLDLQTAACPYQVGLFSNNVLSEMFLTSSTLCLCCFCFYRSQPRCITQTIQSSRLIVIAEGCT